MGSDHINTEILDHYTPECPICKGVMLPERVAELERENGHLKGRLIRAAEIREPAMDHIKMLKARVTELENRNGCLLSGPDRGDCEHYVGLPGISIPDQHDGPDDTFDAYGKPNGWCWLCWNQYKIRELEKQSDQWRDLYQSANEYQETGLEYRNWHQIDGELP